MLHVYGPNAEERRPGKTYVDAAHAFFVRKRRPLYLGEVALEVGLSLARVNQLAADMSFNGMIRELTAAEKRNLGLAEICLVFVLASCKSL